MSTILPPHRPMQPREKTARLLTLHAVTAAVALVALRGYYRDTMGAPGRNDRGIYDDAIFLIAPNAYAAFNANTDPSVERRHVATLQPGVWLYKLGTHGLSRPKDQQYPALVQAGEVRVARFGERSESGFFGINIHRGARGSTSSLGCQTIWPEQWPSFIALVTAELRRQGQKTLPYLLLDA
jgi:lysozyme